MNKSKLKNNIKNAGKKRKEIKMEEEKETYTKEKTIVSPAKDAMFNKRYNEHAFCGDSVKEFADTEHIDLAKKFYNLGRQDEKIISREKSTAAKPMDTLIKRHIDKLGRITIPAIYKKILNWDTNTPLQFYITGTKVFIKRVFNPFYKASHIDSICRITIPARIRKMVGLLKGDTLEISIEKDMVVLFIEKYYCSFCKKEIVKNKCNQLYGKVICYDCLNKLL